MIRVRKLIQTLLSYNEGYAAREIAKLANQILEQEKPVQEPYTEDWHEEVVKEFGGEPISEEDYLQQTIPPPDIDAFNLDLDYPQILKKHKIQPVSASGESEILGEGKFGIVFRVIYQGKPAVAKVIAGEKHKIGETKNWKKILDIYHKLSPEYQKHIPQIYDLITGQTEGIYNGKVQQVEYEIVVMEELFPLSRHLLEIVEGKLSSVISALQDPEFYYQFITVIFDRLNEIIMRQFKTNLHYYLRIPELMKILEPYYSLEVLSSKFRNPLDKTEAAEKIQKIILSRIIDSHEKPEFKRWANDLLRIELQLNSAQEVAERSFSRRFPYTKPYNESDLYKYRYFPETSTFITMLESLVQKFNIRWQDLHEGNMMMDRDGNLKIIDVGLYLT